MRHDLRAAIEDAIHVEDRDRHRRERLSARRDARAIEDLVTSETGDARDDEEVGREELERESRHVRLDRVAASHALERGDRGLCPIGRIQRWNTASAERREKLIHVLLESWAGSDLQLHDLRTARLRRQEVEAVDTDRGGGQAPGGVLGPPNER